VFHVKRSVRVFHVKRSDAGLVAVRAAMAER